MNGQNTGWDLTRAGETEGTLPGTFDAGLYFIGTLRTPFLSRDECPRQGSHDGPECRIEVLPAFAPALAGLARFARVQVLYFMHQARRDLLTQTPRGGETVGTFALRSPVRPNPIASSIVKLERVEGSTLIVRGLDCVDGTPLIDLKPWRD